MVGRRLFGTGGVFACHDPGRSRPAAGGKRIEIVATDIAREQLARAREGLYTQFEIQRGLPMQMLVRHFRKEDAGWRINAKLREMVQFREWNLLADLRPLARLSQLATRNPPRD